MLLFYLFVVINIGIRLVTKVIMEEKFHLRIALTRLVTMNERNIDADDFIGEPGKVQLGFLIFLFRPYILLVIYFKGHRVEASVTHNKDSSMNRNAEPIVLLPEI